MRPVQYIDRRSGQLETEKIYGRWALTLLYGESRISRIFSFFFLPFLARISWLSKFYGYLQKRPRSARKVKPFISAFQIDTSEFAETDFGSFNDFFIRKLKAEARPIEPDPKRAALPADGRYLVFEDLKKTDGFYVKGQKFDLGSFLQNPELSSHYEGGSMLIARLCPTDYHRFHFPVSGTPGKPLEIDGPLFSVNPIALRKKLWILSENKRVLTEIETDLFGKLLYVEVGATCVGSIHQTYAAEKKVQKGDEKGFFSFGGSCLVLLFEREKVVFDEDLVMNSRSGLETKTLFGEGFARPYKIS